MLKEDTDVVIVVDLQADFTELHNGALAVPETGQDYVRDVIERTREFKREGIPVVATRDWHPADHVSFFTSHPGAKPLDVVRVGDLDQTLWPPHCVQGTPGAEILVPADLITEVISTGNRREYDSYSSFEDDGGADTGLKATLEKLGAKRLMIYGLATDYCVRSTVIHALQAGFEVTFDLGLSRGITLETAQAAVQEMKRSGAVVVDRSESSSSGEYRCIPLAPSRRKESPE
jgi:nicotinamidase/pyrazinamidase